MTDDLTGTTPLDRPGVAACAVHRFAESTGTCSHCGNFGCDDCLGHLSGELVCRTCVEDGRVRERPGLPWEDRDTLGTFRAMWQTVRLLTQAPRSLFHRVDPEGGIGEPLRFVLCSLVPASLLWSVFVGGFVGVAVAQDGGLLIAVAAGGVTFLLVPVVLPALFLLVTLLSGIIHHGVLRLLGGGGRGLTATLRANLYGAGVGFWIVVPCVYYVVGYWQMAMNILGYSAVHDDPTWKAVVAVFGPLCLCGGFYGGVFALAALAGGP